MATSIIKKAKLDAMKGKYIQARFDYYNGDQSMLTDAEFDKLEDQIRKHEPDWRELARTGVKVSDKKTDTLLWRFMPSLNKMYEEAVPKFYAKHKSVKEWIWSEKLDGTSLQLVYIKGKATHLITRGDGTTGGDISFFIPHIVKLGLIPATIPSNETPMVFRLEGLMKKSVFAKKWSREAKGDKGADNGRNLVNGLFNRKDMHPALAGVDLVVLGVYGHSLPTGLELAKKWKFKTVFHGITTNKDGHSGFLAMRKKTSVYEMDGIVIAPVDWIMAYADSEKPKGIIAYKFNDEANAAEVKVKRIIYQTSGFGRIIPKVEIEPTQMDGVMVKHCTVHNAKWMLDRGIGPGAIIKMVRSGGVIPKVVGVVKKAKPQFPVVEHELRGVHFYSVEDSAEQDIRIIDRFLSTLGIEFIARKTITSFYEIGLTSPEAYIKLATASDKVIKHTLAPAELGPKQGAKIVGELKRVLCNEISMKQLMVASSCFDVGVGERRLSAIEAAGISMDKLLTLVYDERDDELLEISGFATKTVEVIVKGVLEFEVWFADVKKYLTVNDNLPKVKKVTAKASAKLNGINVTWTGFRDKEAEAIVEANGGAVVAFSSKTTALIYNPEGKASSKVAKAGDKAMTWAEFATKYGVK